MTFHLDLGTRKVPLLAFLVSFSLFMVSFLFLRQGPVLESMSPRIGNAGQKVVLGGRYFGSQGDDGWITLAGERILPENILSWDSGEIVFKVPENPGSGPVVIHTGNGRSRKLLFTYQEHIPVLMSERNPRRAAWVASASAPRWAPGMPCTLKGGSFGSDLRDGWIRVGTNQVSESDILSWNNETVTFILPVWEGPGELAFADVRSESTPIALPSMDGVWTPRAESLYQVVMAAEIGEVELEGQVSSGLVTAYVPRPGNIRGQVLEDISARDAELVPGAWAFVVNNPQPDTSYDHAVSFQVRRTLSFPSSAEDPGLEFPDIKEYEGLLGASRLVPAANAGIKSFVKAHLLPQSTPLSRVEQLFGAVLAAIEPDSEAGFAYGADVLGDGKGSSFGYAGLLVSVLRQAGIPSLIVEGVLVKGSEVMDRFWVQALVPGLGWFEMDPYEAEFSLRRDNAQNMRELMFSSAGVDHILLSRGEHGGSITRMDPEVRKSFQRNVLLGITGESSGNIVSYGLFMPPLQIRKLQ